jgi:hypothetical protein
MKSRMLLCLYGGFKIWLVVPQSLVRSRINSRCLSLLLETWDVTNRSSKPACFSRVSSVVPGIVIFHLRFNQCPGLCPKSGWWDWWIPLPTAAWGNVLNLTLIFAFISLFCGEIWWRPCVGQCNEHGLSAILYCCLSTYSFQEQQRPYCHLHQGSCT